MGYKTDLCLTFQDDDEGLWLIEGIHKGKYHWIERESKYQEGFENPAETINYLFNRVLTGCSERRIYE